MRIRGIDSPLAIAMWDFSWLQRHYPTDSFSDWPGILDQLVDRGYNAVRIDAFPLLVAADGEGKVEDSFHYPRNNWSPAMWGNQFTTTTHPRSGLIEFLKLCEARDVAVGLSTWFFPAANRSVEHVAGVEDFVRVWDETLQLLADNDCMRNVVYVDLLNEYPLFHGFKWLTNELEKRADKDRPEDAERWFNDEQIAFYNGFADETIKALAEKWPGLDFMYCLPKTSTVPWQDVDLSRFAALDMHVWFVHSDFGARSGYFETFHGLSNKPNDLAFAAGGEKINRMWAEEKERLTEWMENEIAQAAAAAHAHGIPVGNTEGWGPINWIDHPGLDWTMTKEAGEICAHLGAKYGYAFNCTSNYTHPHFRGIWDDVDWHRRLTSIIKAGRLQPV